MIEDEGYIVRGSRVAVVDEDHIAQREGETISKHLEKNFIPSDFIRVLDLGEGLSVFLESVPICRCF